MSRLALLLYDGTEGERHEDYVMQNLKSSCRSSSGVYYTNMKNISVIDLEYSLLYIEYAILISDDASAPAKLETGHDVQ